MTIIPTSFSLTKPYYYAPPPRSYSLIHIVALVAFICLAKVAHAFDCWKREGGSIKKLDCPYVASRGIGTKLIIFDWPSHTTMDYGHYDLLLAQHWETDKWYSHVYTGCFYDGRCLVATSRDMSRYDMIHNVLDIEGTGQGSTLIGARITVVDDMHRQDMTFITTGAKVGSCPFEERDDGECLSEWSHTMEGIPWGAMAPSSDLPKDGDFTVFHSITLQVDRCSFKLAGNLRVNAYTFGIDIGRVEAKQGIVDIHSGSALISHRQRTAHLDVIAKKVDVRGLLADTNLTPQQYAEEEEKRRRAEARRQVEECPHCF